MKPWGLWLDGYPWGPKRFWTFAGAMHAADEHNRIRRVLGLQSSVIVYNRRRP